MSLSPSILADRYFPQPCAPRALHTAIHARPALTQTKAPPLYRVTLNHRAQWRQLWRQLFTHNHLRLHGPALATHPCLTLVFQSPCSTAPTLALCARLIQIDDESFIVTSPRPGLSWRLAAVRLARHLPTSPPNEPHHVDRHTPARADALPPDRPLRLRWDLPGAASSITSDQPFAHIITALRAGFPTPRQLATLGHLSSQELADFLLSLKQTNLLQQAPILFKPTSNPFDFMGLHWSADQKLIRHRYHLLDDALHRLPTPPGTKKRLDKAYQLLSCPELRTALRRAILPPPVIAEVIDLLQQRLAIAKIEQNSPQTIAICRTILELRFPDSAPTPSPPPL